ncbi:MAG: MATE family efflux transporter [Fibrobacterota bacterium]
MLSWLFDKPFLKRIGALAIPIALQELFVTLLQFVDTVMVSHIVTDARTEAGESIAIAAVSFAGNNLFLFILLLVGITSGLSIFSAQYWGAGDAHNARKTLGLSMLGAAGAAFIFAVPSFIFAEEFIRFFSTEPEVVRMGALYLRILVFSYICTGLTFSISSVLKSITDVKTPIIISSGAVILNTGLNYLLIFGKFGAPELGVAGAAIGTLIAKSLETAVLIGSLYLRRSPLASTNWRDYFVYPAGFVIRKVRTTLPVVGNEMGWALGVFVYNKIYATVGTDAAMSFTLAERVSFLFMVIFIGTSAATATLSGNTIGRGDLKQAQDDSGRILILFTGIGIILGLLCILSAPLWTAHVFQIETEHMRQVINALIISTAVILPFKVINIHGVNGLMRSGGDTTFSMFVDILSLWGIGVPLGIISAIVFGLPLWAVYLIIGTEEVAKAVVVINRVRTGRWINRVIENPL